MRINVRVRPGARGDAVGGRWDGPRDPALLVAVRARAVDGGANAAVLAVVTAAFGIRRSEVEMVSGSRGRDKILELCGDEAQVGARLAALLKG